MHGTEKCPLGIFMISKRSPKWGSLCGPGALEQTLQTSVLFPKNEVFGWEICLQFVPNIETVTASLVEMRPCKTQPIPVSSHRPRGVGGHIRHSKFLPR